MRCKNFFRIFVLVFLIFFVSCKNKAEKIQSQKDLFTHNSARELNEWILEIQKNYEDSLNEFLNSLSLEQKIAQLFIVNLEGKSDFRPVENYSSVTKNKDDFRPLIPGGYIFFSYNLEENPQKVRDFTTSINNYCVQNNEIPPFLAADQEGGIVQRFSKLSGEFPSQNTVSKKFDVNSAKKLYSLQAKQMSLMGFHMNLSPVAEILTDENIEFLASRSFGNSQNVYDYGKTFISAFNSQNVSSVLKHFPGNTNTDPHSGLPEIKLSKDELQKNLLPFKKLIAEKPDAVLMSHARTSCLDSKVPACLSYEWVTNVLRNQYRFDGIVFSDDIFMKALAENGFPPEIAVVKAIESGVDCIMISEKRFSEPVKILYEKSLNDTNFLNRINESAKRIIRYKIKAGILEYTKNSNGKLKINSKMILQKNITKEFQEVKNQNQILVSEKLREK